MARTLAFPVRLNEAGQYRMVDQDSDDDILGCAYMALLCPHGHRDLDPEYGAPSLEFTPARLDRAAVLRDQLLRDEPRLLDIDASEQVDALVASTTISLQGVRA